MRRTPILIATAVVVLLVVALVVVRRRSEAPAASAEPETQVASASADTLTLDAATQQTIGLQVQAAEERPFAEHIQTTGVVGPNETRVATIRVLSPGRVDQVQARVGDRVAAGQPLLTYDNVELGDLAGEYLAGTAAVDRAAAEAEVSHRAVERASSLIEAGGLSRAEFERREAEYQRALAAVTSERAALSNVEKKIRRYGLGDSDLTRLRTSVDASALSTSTVRSPFAGVVTAASVAPGDVVDPQRELFTVVDLSTVWVSGDVYQKDIGAVRQGQEAHITVESYPGETFVGRVTYVGDALDPATRTVKVRCEVPNRNGRLKLQMFVNVLLPTMRERATIVIPPAAVQEMDGRPTVFVETSANTFQKRAIKTGDAVGGWVPVAEGLAKGDRVVTTGAFMLKSKLNAASIGEGEEAEEKK